MIGEIRKAITSFYDVKNRKMSYKGRPALVIAKADAHDYVVLPVSSISRPEDRHAVYDIEVNPAVYPALNLKNISYVRTHKQTIIHGSQMGDTIGDMKGTYEDLYLLILEKREQFSKEISTQAISE